MTNEEFSAKAAEARGEVFKGSYSFDPHYFKYLAVGMHSRKNIIGSAPDAKPFSDAYADVKPYATDMNAAWELVEEWKSVTGWAGISWEDGVWIVSWKGAGVNEEIMVSDEDLCRAICKAYLKFKGVEYDDYISSQGTVSL